MIDPETYYEIELKGKTPEEIHLIIKNLNHQIGMLIHQIEQPLLWFEFEIYPSKHTQLQYTRLYLERAKKTLVDAGGTYTPSNRECRIAEFHNRLEHLEKIELTIHRDASFSKS